MELVGLWRYPVKSMQGERLDRARVEDTGSSAIAGGDCETSGRAGS
jgi:uncharacterized protein YcbX